MNPSVTLVPHLWLIWLIFETKSKGIVGGLVMFLKWKQQGTYNYSSNNNNKIHLKHAYFQEFKGTINGKTYKYCTLKYITEIDKVLIYSDHLNTN